MSGPEHLPKSKAPIVAPPPADVAAAAALAICESLLLALNDHKILPEREILGVLRDAAAAHNYDPGDDGQTELHEAVATLIHKIIEGGNSVRRP
ncbi:hypothetical protein [Cypionkella psychrotolerans]|uniref:hypothetical protein n=1 Tax=Cypionkella psychrotolerans TaxID=1678131 RepID=UPI0006B4F129|nr:hypothetical protein [Cypionkella psychrotolerans]